MEEIKLGQPDKLPEKLPDKLPDNIPENLPDIKEDVIKIEKVVPPKPKKVNNLPATFSERGYLYVRIIKAKDMCRKDNKVYVNLRIEDGASSPEKVRTEVSQPSTDPKWFEEFLFSVSNRKYPLKIHVWAKLVTPNVSMGTYLYPLLNSLPDNTPTEEWLKLDSVSSGEINLLLYFYPTPSIPKDISFKLDKIRLVLERNNFYPGEKVKGIIVYTTIRDKKKLRVEFDCLGSQTTKWIESYHRSNKVAENRNPERKTITKRTTTQYFNCTKDVLDIRELLCNPDREPILSAGYYIFPFSFTIPITAPPTCELEYGRVDYSMKININCDTVVNSEKSSIEQNFSVIEPTFQLVEESPLVVSNKRRCVSQNSHVELNLSINSNMVVVGTSISAYINLDNSSPNTVTSIELELVKKLAIKTEKQTTNYKESVFKKQLEQNIPISPNTNVDFNELIPIELDAIPSMPRDSLIEVTYELKATAKIPGFQSRNGMIDCKLPVLVRAVLPDDIKDVIAPKTLDESFPPHNRISVEDIETEDYPKHFWIETNENAIKFPIPKNNLTSSQK